MFSRNSENRSENMFLYVCVYPCLWFIWPICLLTVLVKLNFLIFYQDPLTSFSPYHMKLEKLYYHMIILDLCFKKIRDCIQLSMFFLFFYSHCIEMIDFCFVLCNLCLLSCMWFILAGSVAKMGLSTHTKSVEQLMKMLIAVLQQPSESSKFMTSH